MGATVVTSLGNEGFLVESASLRVFVDAFTSPLPETGPVGLGALARAPADAILVTHAHWDHFDAAAVAAAAAGTGAAVVGPAAVIRRLGGKVPAAQLVEAEPAPAADGGPARWVDLRLGTLGIRAYRTFHSRGHNSYRVDTGGFRFLHDGDNEDTRRFQRDSVGELDALMVGPWQGSGYVEFVEMLRPARWFLMHLSLEELGECDRGTFLTETCGCDRVPAGLVVLRPGEALTIN